MDRLNVIFLFLILIPWTVFGQAEEEIRTPSIEEVISLRSVSNVQISPNGKHVLFQVESTDWHNNRFDSELWLSRDGEPPFQLTNNLNGDSFSPVWSPNSDQILFLRNHNDKNQIFFINISGGEPQLLSYIDKNIQQFSLSPNARTIAFLGEEKISEEEEELKKRYGNYSFHDQDYRLNRLYTIPFDSNFVLNEQITSKKDSINTVRPKAAQITTHLTKTTFSINNLAWRPGSNQIIITHQPNPNVTSFLESDLSIYDLESQELKTIVRNKSVDSFITWSPDGQAFMYLSSIDNVSTNFILNDRYFIYDMVSSSSKEIASSFDENLQNIIWMNGGIFATAYQKTTQPIFQINPTTGAVVNVFKDKRLISDISVSQSGSEMAIIARDGNELNEVYLVNTDKYSFKKLTDINSQIKKWKTSQNEVISWKSKDGTIIEGVLHKPYNFNPAEKYPLLVIIHGGPTGISLPHPVPSKVYPFLQWLDKGTLILEPNYRGSAGYGERFRSLNQRNLGIGDSWDVLSGVDFLNEKGLVDTARLGTMGWSQGGYISAFLATYSNRFKAASVGAGISNWVTYYVNTDIHQFTRQYLLANPWQDMEIYNKTSPISYINNASTPTLIQHGELDSRVPIANAYELYQGFQDVGVKSNLIIYKGFGHNITKPKERLAATWHNWQWFGKYFWDEDIELQ